MQPPFLRRLMSRPTMSLLPVCFTFILGITVANAFNGSIGVMVPLRWNGVDSPVEPWAARYAIAAAMAVHHINNRVASLVPKAAELLPANFKLVYDLKDTMALPSVAVKHAVAWNEEGRHAIIGSYRSAVTGPLALAASIAATPVIAWGATASTLSDRDTYPTISRTIISDAMFAESVIRAISSMGWTRIAILYVDDAWGRGFAQDAMSSARKFGVDVVVAAGFALGDRSAIAEAVQEVAVSGVRVTVAMAFESDTAVLAAEAESHKMLDTGYTWIMSAGTALHDVVATSDDPKRTLERLTGWLDMAIDPSLGKEGVQFRTVFESVPLAVLNSSELDSEGILTEAVRSGPCDMFCVSLYDAVWTAAIAMSRMEVAEDGSVDKVALLAAIRNTSFEGASGQVQFDATGERDARGQPLWIRNAQQVTAADGTVLLSSVPVWRWQTGANGQETLERAGNIAPVWPGGKQGWEPPYEVVECEAGSVFSTSSLQCEPCPKTTVEEDGECVRYDANLGVLVPLRWGGPDSDMPSFALRWAAAAAMALHHINNRVASLVPKAAELLPPNFKLVIDLQDTMAQPSVAVKHAVAFNQEGKHAIIGSLRSAVTGPLALAASIDATPVISWASTASSLVDTATYPTLGRTVLSDAMLATGTIQSMLAIGWRRIAILYVDDAWGRSLAQDLVAVASDSGVGMEIVKSVDYVLGEMQSIQDAVATIAGTDAHIVVCAVYDSDLALVAEAADDWGMVSAGHSWIVLSDMNFNAVVSLSPDPAKTHERLTGWMSASTNLLYSGRGERYKEVYQSEPLEHLNYGILDGFVSAEIVSDFDEYCAALYDAVWTAAIAMSRMEVAEDGSVDKVALLAAIRNTSFEGATGQVQFDATGERNPAGIPLVLRNLRPRSRRAGELELAAVVTWEWWPDGTGSGSLSPQGEEAPFWPGGKQTWTAPNDGICPAGFAFARGGGDCQPCPPGTAILDGACEACPLGTFSDTWGAVQCQRCQIGFANTTGMTQCSPCPDKTVRSAASPGVSASECLCVLGYYSQLGPGFACEACSTGAACDGGAMAPYPVEGFWYASHPGGPGVAQFGVGNKSCPHWDSFVPCNPSDNCKGGPDFECSPGRKGRLCLETEEGWTNVGGVFYWECGSDGKVTTVAGILGVLVVWFMINALAAGQFPALNIALMFVQVTAIIGSFGLRWHSYLHYLNLAMGIANFDVDFVSAACLVPWTPITSFYFQLSLPFVFGALYITYFLVVEFWRFWRDRGKSKIHYKRMLRQTLKYSVSFVLTNYTTLAVKCFQSLRCTAFPDGRTYMYFAASVECWTGSHWAMVSMATLYIAGILVGLPLGLWWVLSRHRRAGTLHSIQAEWQWGFVHQPFEADFKWWECVLIFRRFTIAFIAVMIPEPMLQGGATLIVLATMLSAQTFTAPFIRADIDILDFLAICGSMLYALSGMLFYPSLTAQAQGHLCYEGADSPFCAHDNTTKQIISVVAFTAIAGMVLLAVAVTLRSVLEARASLLATKNIRGQQNMSRAESRAITNQSVNRLALDQVLHGGQLLKWSRNLAHQFHSTTYRASSLQFLEVEESLMAVDVDMSASSFNTKANVMRHLCDLPGFVDYLIVTEEAGVAAASDFINYFASFLENAELAGHTQFYSERLTLFEHRPLLCYWLATTEDVKRRMFHLLVQAIHRANGNAPGTCTPPASSPPRSPSRSVRGNAPGTCTPPASSPPRSPSRCVRPSVCASTVDRFCVSNEESHGVRMASVAEASLEHVSGPGAPVPDQGRYDDRTLLRRLKVSTVYADADEVQPEEHSLPTAREHSLPTAHGVWPRQEDTVVEIGHGVGLSSSPITSAKAAGGRSKLKDSGSIRTDSGSGSEPSKPVGPGASKNPVRK